MYFPAYRARRLRRNANLRSMIRETHLRVEDMIYPMFSAFGENIKKEIPSMPGIYQQSIENIVAEAKEVYTLGIPAVILFGIPETKDPLGLDAYCEHGIIQNTVRAIKEAVPQLTVITDVCMCEYTDHGHCGVIKDGDVDNDGVPDIVVGAPFDDQNALNAGSVWVYSGKTGKQLHAFHGKAAHDSFGISACGAGDVDKDGVPDFAVGDDNSTVRIYSGKTAAMLKQLTTGGGGVALGELGDVDNDGYADVLIGAFYNHEAKVYSGKTFAVIRTFSGTTGEQFGWAVSGVGDLDNDKVPDLAIGAPNNAMMPSPRTLLTVPS